MPNRLVVALLITIFCWSSPAAAQQFRPYPDKMWDAYIHGDFADALALLKPVAAECSSDEECAHLLAMQAKIEVLVGSFQDGLNSANAARAFADSSGNADLQLQAMAAQADAMLPLNKLQEMLLVLQEAGTVIKPGMQGRGPSEIYFAFSGIALLTNQVNATLKKVREEAKLIGHGNCSRFAIDLCAELWSAEPTAAIVAVGFEEELRLTNRNLGYIGKHTGTDSHAYGEMLIERANTLETLGRVAESERDYIAGMAIIEARVGTSHESYASAMASYAELLAGQTGREAEAAGLLMQSAERIVAWYGQGTIELALEMIDLGSIAMDLGAVTEAQQLAETGYAAMVALAGTEWMGPAYAQTVLATAYLNLGETEKADLAAKSAMETFGKLFGQESFLTDALRVMRGAIAMNDGQLTEAEQFVLPAVLRLARDRQLGASELQAGSGLLTALYLQQPGRLGEARHWNRFSIEQLLMAAEQSGTGAEGNNEVLRENRETFSMLVDINWRLAQGER